LLRRLTLLGYDSVVAYGSVHGFENGVRTFGSLAKLFPGRGIVANHIGGLTSEPFASELSSGRLSLVDVTSAQSAIYRVPPNEVHLKLNLRILQARLLAGVLVKLLCK